MAWFDVNVLQHSSAIQMTRINSPDQG